MARPNLSFENLALVVAALSAAACSRPAEPSAVRVDPATAASAPTTPTATPTAPSAGASASATAPAAQPEAPTTKIGEAKRAAATTTGSPAATELPRDELRKQTTSSPGRRGHGATGQASCGAGTCTADMKKK